MKIKKIQAFGLAELLITMAIMGVVALLAIPMLYSDTNKTIDETGWKKQFSNISSAFDRVVLDHGGSVVGAFESNADYYDYFGDILSTNKRCESNSATQGCVNANYSAAGLDVSSSNPGYMLNDSTSIYFTSASSDCSKKSGDINYCGIAVIDVNAHKGPNKLGKDVFVAYFTKDRLLPVGAQGDVASNKVCDPTNGGIGCSASILSTSSLIYGK